MILNLKLPDHIIEEFKKQFDRDIGEYWNSFYGWLLGNSTEALLDDFETLTEAQNRVIGDIVSHEGEVFDDFRKWADDELTRRDRRPFKLEFRDYPPYMEDDIIEKDFD